jgi:hypothetical protein
MDNRSLFEILLSYLEVGKALLVNYLRLSKKVERQDIKNNRRFNLLEEKVKKLLEQRPD